MSVSLQNGANGSNNNNTNGVVKFSAESLKAGETAKLTLSTELMLKEVSASILMEEVLSTDNLTLSVKEKSEEIAAISKEISDLRERLVEKTALIEAGKNLTSKEFNAPMPKRLWEARVSKAKDSLKKDFKRLISLSNFKDMAKANPEAVLDAMHQITAKDMEVNEFTTCLAMAVDGNNRFGSKANTAFPLMGTVLLKHALDNGLVWDFVLDIARIEFKGGRKKSAHVKAITITTGSVAVGNMEYSYSFGIRLRDWGNFDLRKAVNYATHSVPYPNMDLFLNEFNKTNIVEWKILMDTSEQVKIWNEWGSPSDDGRTGNWDRTTYFNPSRKTVTYEDVTDIANAVDADIVKKFTNAVYSVEQTRWSYACSYVLPENYDGVAFLVDSSLPGFRKAKDGMLSKIAKVSGYSDGINHWLKGTVCLISLEEAKKAFGPLVEDKTLLVNDNVLKIMRDGVENAQRVTFGLVNVGQNQNDSAASIMSLDINENIVNYIIDNNAAKLSAGVVKLNKKFAQTCGNIIPMLPNNCQFETKAEAMSYAMNTLKWVNGRLSSELAEKSVIFDENSGKFTGLWVVTNNPAYIRLAKSGNGAATLVRPPAYGMDIVVLAFMAEKPQDGYGYTTVFSIGTSVLNKNQDWDGDGFKIQHSGYRTPAMYEAPSLKGLNYEALIDEAEVLARGFESGVPAERQKAVKWLEIAIATKWAKASDLLGLKVNLPVNEYGKPGVFGITDYCASEAFIGVWTKFWFFFNESQMYSELRHIVEVPVQAIKHGSVKGNNSMFLLFLLMGKMAELEASFKSKFETYVSDSGRELQSNYKFTKRNFQNNLLETKAFQAGEGFLAIMKNCLDKAVQSGEAKVNALAEKTGMEVFELISMTSNRIDTMLCEYFEAATAEFITKAQRADWYANTFTKAVIDNDIEMMACLTVLSDTDMATYAAFANGDKVFVNESLTRKPDKEWKYQFHTLVLGKLYADAAFGDGSEWSVFNGCESMKGSDPDLIRAAGVELAKLIDLRDDKSKVAGFVSHFHKAKAVWLALGISPELISDTTISLNGEVSEEDILF